MIRYLFITFLLCFITDFSSAQTAYSQALSCNRGGFSLGYIHHMPAADSLTSIGGFALDITFLKTQLPYFNSSFGIEFSTGGRSFDRAVEDLVFAGSEVDYNGYASYGISRIDVMGKYIIGAQLGRFVEFGIPIRFGFRAMRFSEEFGLYEGQEIAEADLVSGDEAAKENTDVFYRSNKLGFGSGLNLTFAPNNIVSPFIELNFNYFGGEDVPMPNYADLVNGLPSVPTRNLANNNEMTFRVGVRFNIGCPGNVTNVYRSPSSTGRTAEYSRHPAVETRIVQRSSSSSSSSSNNTNKEERVILNPRQPRQPRTPQP
jgi:hypothetical protein